MRHTTLLIPIILISVCFSACERVDQAVNTYKKAKEMKSDFQTKSDEVQKRIAERSEDYKDRIRKKAGLATRGERKDSDDSVAQDDKEAREQPREDHDKE
jgi:hypothetical protein